MKVRSPPRKLRFSQLATPRVATRVPSSKPAPIFTVLSGVGVTRKTTGTAVGRSPSLPISGAASTDPKTRRSLSADCEDSSRAVEYGSPGTMAMAWRSRDSGRPPAPSMRIGPKVVSGPASMTTSTSALWVIRSTVALASTEAYA